MFLFCFNSTNAQSTFSPTSEAKGFNVFVKNNLTLTAGDTHGPVACGLDLVLNGNTILAMNNTGTFPDGAGAGSNYGLVIGNKIIYTSGNSSSVNQGFIRLGNTTGSKLYYTDPNNALTNLRITNGEYNNNPNVQLQRQQASPTATNASGLSFTNAFTVFNANAKKIDDYNNPSICALNINKIIISSGSNPHIKLLENKINYINLTSDQLTNLNSQGSIIFDNSPSASRILIFNIQATGAYNWTTPNFGGLNESDGAYILWNFYNTTSLVLGGSNSIYGTLFAPLADIVKSGANNNNGQIIGSSLKIAYGEIHYFPFTAALSDCSSEGGPLPISLLDFTAIKQNKVVTLNWQTSVEQNSGYFDVEFSKDGSKFENIGSVKATGVSTTLKSYSLVHLTPVNGVNFYRLKIVDVDGTYKYGPVRIVKFGNSTTISILPNPTTDRVFITSNDAGVLQSVGLYSINGKLLQLINNFTLGKSIDLSTYAPSLYILKLIDKDGNTEVLKVVRK